MVVDAGSRERSRSPVRAALPGLRRDAPGRREVAPARMPDLALHSDRVAAIAALERDVLAASTTRTNSARLGTISSMLALWGLEPFPPTPTTWKALAATLKQGGYRSAAVYLSCYKLECERRGFPETSGRTGSSRTTPARAQGVWGQQFAHGHLTYNAFTNFPWPELHGSTVALSIAKPPSSWDAGGFAGRWSWPQREPPWSSFRALMAAGGLCYTCRLQRRTS